MTKELKRVVWEWLPGLVAGLIPLAVFLFVSVEAVSPTGRYDSLAQLRFDNGLAEHFLILAIVTSAVSTFTAFPRLFAFNRDDAPLGEGSLILVMLITLILVFSVAMYVLREADTVEIASLHDGGFAMSVGLALAAAICSYYLEVTIANLRLKHRAAPAA